MRKIFSATFTLLAVAFALMSIGRGIAEQRYHDWFINSGPHFSGTPAVMPGLPMIGYLGIAFALAMAGLMLWPYQAKR